MSLLTVCQSASLYLGIAKPDQIIGVDTRNADELLETVKDASEEIMKARGVVRGVYVDDRIKDYVVNLIDATRNPAAYGLDLGDLIRFGASPRATIFLAQAAKAHAFIQQRGFVTPEDIKAMGHDVLRHRVIRSYEAEAEEIAR